MSDADSGLSPELKALMAEVDEGGEPESDAPVAMEPTLSEDDVETLPNAGDHANLDAPHLLEPSGTDPMQEGGPMSEPEPAPYMENPSDYNFEVSMAEDRVDIASMPLADYQAWLFPPKGEDGHEEGTNTLEMIWATLTAAGFEEDLAKTKIAATLWSRRHYEGETPSAARHIVQRVPASKIVNYLPPSMEVKALESLSPVPIHMAKEAESETNWMPLAVASGVALLIPILATRQMK